MKRQKAASIRLLSAVVNNESAALYLRVQSARSLLQVKPEPKDEDEVEFPVSSGGKIIIIPRGEIYDPDVHGRAAVVLPQKDDPFPGEGSGKIIILPDNERGNIVAERQRQRLALLAEISIPDGDDEPQPMSKVPAAPPRKPTGRERLRRLRAKRRATRDAPSDMV